MVESSVEVSSLIGGRSLWRLVASVVLIGVIAGLGYWGFIRDNKPAAVATTQEVKGALHDAHRVRDSRR